MSQSRLGEANPKTSLRVAQWEEEEEAGLGSEQIVAVTASVTS